MDSEYQHRLTVGMPVYNSEEYIREAVDSILNQTFNDFSLLISDNASTDGTREICEAYARNDSRVKYVRQPTNLGANGNYNYVFKSAAGTYFKWASSNDYCVPTLLERCVEVLDQRPDVALVYPGTRLFSRNLKEFHEYAEALNATQESPMARMLAVVDQLRLNNIMNGVIRSEMLRKTPAMATFHAADCCMMAELALHGKFIRVPEYLFYRRMDEDSSISMGDEQSVRDHLNPTSKKPLRFQSWKRRLYYFGAIRRSRLGIRDSIELTAELVRRMIWERNTLLREIMFWKPDARSSRRTWEQL